MRSSRRGQGRGPGWLQRGGGRNDPWPPSRPHLRLFGYPWGVRVPRRGRRCVLRGGSSPVPSPCYLRVTTTSGPGGTPFQHVMSLQGTGTSPSDRAGRCRRRWARSRTPDPPARVGVAPSPAPNPSAQGWSPFPAGLRSRGGFEMWTGVLDLVGVRVKLRLHLGLLTSRPGPAALPPSGLLVGGRHAVRGALGRARARDGAADVADGAVGLLQLRGQSRSLRGQAVQDPGHVGLPTKEGVSARLGRAWDAVPCSSPTVPSPPSRRGRNAREGHIKE